MNSETDKAANTTTTNVAGKKEIPKDVHGYSR